MTGDAALVAEIREQALFLGFDLVGFAPAAMPVQGERLPAWLDAGYQGGMAWLERRPERRQDPRLLHPATATVVVLGINTRPGLDPPSHPPGQALIATHAQGRDYHQVLRDKGERLVQWLTQRVGRAVSGRICVDSAPLMEKPLAQAAGLGWQGKNTLLVTRSHGCWLLLAEILLELPLLLDPPGRDLCGTCVRCLEACPTRAFAAPYVLDTRRCLSYWTIEHKGSIPLAMREAMGTRIYGCDDCLMVCPWNRFAPVAGELGALPGLARPHLRDFRGLDEAGFLALFGQTPVARIGWVRFLRNLAVALGHWRDPEAVVMARELCGHAHELVREHAAWALARLGGGVVK